MLIIFLTINLGFSQKGNFKEGYIIELNGDTIYGLIKHRAQIVHSEYVTFKKDSKSKKISYSPEELLKYHFDGSNYYESDSILFRGDANQIYFKKLFVKKLIEGKIELYRLDHELTEAPSVIYKYESKFYFFKEKGNNALIDLHESNYKLKLEDAFKSKRCELEKGKNYNFSDEGLKNLISEYNKCTGSAVKVLYLENPNEGKNKLRLGLSIGLGFTKMNTSNRKFEDYEISPQFSYGLGGFFLYKFGTALTLRGGITYDKKSQNGKLNYTVLPPYVNEGEEFELMSNISTSQVKTPWQLLYVLREGKYKPYLYFGGYFGVVTKFTSYLDRYDFEHIDGENFIVAKRIDPFKTISKKAYEMGLSVGVGVEIQLQEKRNLIIELEYERGKNEAKKGALNYINNEGLIFKLGYVLAKKK